MNKALATLIDKHVSDVPTALIPPNAVPASINAAALSHQFGFCSAHARSVASPKKVRIAAHPKRHRLFRGHRTNTEWERCEQAFPPQMGPSTDQDEPSIFSGATVEITTPLRAPFSIVPLRHSRRFALLTRVHFVSNR